MPRVQSLGRFALVAVALVGVATTAHAQLGSGWTETSFTRKIHLDDEAGLQTFDWTTYKSVCSPVCADYSYSSANDTHTFRLIDNRTNRSEIRLQNEYSSGRKQFEGYVTFGSPLDDESLMQIFGSTTGATQMMLRGYAASGGSMNGAGAVVATGVYGVEQRVNVFHTQGSFIRIYVNGSQKAEIVDDESVTNYWKFGCYGTLRTGAVTVKWRRVRTYTDGNPPGLGTDADTDGDSRAPGDSHADPHRNSGALRDGHANPHTGPRWGFSGYYRIMGQQSGRALVVLSASTANSVAIIIYDYNDNATENDEWQVLSIGSGYYRIIARHSGKDMVIQSASTANGAGVIQYTYSTGTTTNDEWQIVDSGSGLYEIRNRLSGKNVQAMGSTNSSAVQQQADNNSSNQRFQLISIP